MRGTAAAEVAAGVAVLIFSPRSVRALRSLLLTVVEVAGVVRDVTPPTFCADERLARAGVRAVVRAGASEKAEAEATRQAAGRIL